jgi:hypothetical protein
LGCGEIGEYKAHESRQNTRPERFAAAFVHIVRCIIAALL